GEGREEGQGGGRRLTLRDGRPSALDERPRDLDLVRGAGKRCRVVDRRREQPRDRRDTGERDRRLRTAAGGGDADERERPALAVHRLQVRRGVGRGHVEVEDHLAQVEGCRAAVGGGREGGGGARRPPPA